MSGTPPAWGTPPGPVGRTTNPTSLWALVVGVLSLPAGLIVFASYGVGPLLAGGASIVLGVVALRQVGRSDGRQRGRAAAWVGLAFGILTTLIGVVTFFLTGMIDFFVWIAQAL